MDGLIRCRLTCRDEKSTIRVLALLRKAGLGNENFSIEKERIDIMCQEDELEEIKRVLSSTNRHFRLEIWIPKDNLPAESMAAESPGLLDLGVGVVFLFDESQENLLGSPYIKTQGKRPDA